MNPRTHTETRLASAWSFSMLALVIMAGSMSAVFGGCALRTSGTMEGDAGTACGKASDCDDENACTVDKCGGDGACTHTEAKDGPAPDDAQVPFDCKKIFCVGGEEHEEDDNADPVDDGNDCTRDTCAGGVAHHTPVDVGTSCETGNSNGRCDAQGKCQVTCSDLVPCPAPADLCNPQICDTSLGVCVDAPLQDGTTPTGLVDIPGDCKVSVCISGKTTPIPDNSDVPTAAAGECEQAVCQNGVPSNPPKTGNPACNSFNGSQPGHCDDSGHCAGCSEDGHCTGQNDECQRPACVNFACQQAFTPLNPPHAVAAQTSGDCGTTICDGAGSTTIVYNSADPESDNNECTKDTCASIGTTVPSNVNNGTLCGATNSLSCLNGKCQGCVNASQCLPSSCLDANTLTKAQTCGAGACNSAGTQACAPYFCNSAGTAACNTKCSADTDCVSGYYCTGTNGTCKIKVTQGGACTSDGQCGTGHCVDNVCCAVNACGPCEACAAALKPAGGIDGVCGAAKNNTDPHNDCTDQGAASCGTTGVCNGSGACTKYPNTTTCAAAVCTSGQATSLRKCDGNGTCVTGTVTACSPVTVCNGAGTACATTCTGDAQCISGDYCNASSACVVKVTNGGTCAAAGTGHDCVSGRCGSNNVCCAAACTGGACGTTACTPGSGVCSYPTGKVTGCTDSCASGSVTAKACNGSGTCNMGAATPCSPVTVCNTGGTACATTCTGDPQCISGDYCDAASHCVAKGAGGDACSGASACNSGICGGGFCCAAACTGGTCGTAACLSGSGACDYPSGNTCGSASCTGSGAGPYSYTPAGKCDGGGACTPGTAQSCGEYICTTGAGCYMSCTDATRCVTGDYCDTTTSTCQDLKADGATCSANGQCLSSKCGLAGAGHCCKAACSPSGGVCGIVDCDTSGECAVAPVGTSCASEGSSCTAGTVSTPTTCDGAGACQYSTSSCTPYAGCNGTVCASTCSGNNSGGDNDCATSFFCNGAICTGPQAAGAPCHANAMCTSNSCDISGAKTCN